MTTEDEVLAYIGRRLVDTRVSRGLSQRAAAEIVGLPYMVLGSYERANRKMPVTTLYNIAVGYELSPAFFLPVIVPDGQLYTIPEALRRAAKIVEESYSNG